MIRSSMTWRALAATAAASLVLTACGTTEDDNGSGADGEGECSGKIGFFGALSGSNASIVTPSRDGAKLAIQEAAESGECDVEMVEFDSEGDPAKATNFANEVVADPEYLGVIGGAFSGETRGTKETYQAGGVTMISPSATATDLTTVDQVEVFHRVIGYDEVQGAAVARYVSQVLQSDSVYVIDDSTTYGGPLADKIKSELGDAVIGSDKVQEGDRQFDATVAKVARANPEVIIYAGYAAEAGPLAKQLRNGGVTGQFFGTDGVYGNDFITAAGDASEGAIVSCPCLPADEAGGSFADDFEAEFGARPGAYAAEGYDAARIFIDAFVSGASTREEVLDFVNNYEKDGLTKTYKFDEKGDVAEENVVIWTYKVEGGALVPDQEIPK